MSCVEREREREREREVRVCIHTSLFHVVGCFDLNNDMDPLYKLWACNPSNITLDQGVDWSPDSCSKMAYKRIDMHMQTHWFNSLSANSKGVYCLKIVQWSLDKQLMQQEKIWHAQELCDASFHTTGSSKCTILFLSCRTICETNFI
jgi:hypothetical protein